MRWYTKERIEFGVEYTIPKNALVIESDRKGVVNSDQIVVEYDNNLFAIYKDSLVPAHVKELEDDLEKLING